MYPEYMPLEDEIILAEEQPLPAVASPTTDSPGYVPESNPEEESEADDDEDPKEDPADYPADKDMMMMRRRSLPEMMPMMRTRTRMRRRRSTQLLPTLSHLYTLLFSDPRADKPEITLLPRKRLGIDLGLRCEVGESSAAAAARPITGHRADYGFVDTVGAKISRQRAEEEQDTEDIYGVIEDTQDQEDLVSWEAWGRSMEVSYMTRSEIMALRSIVMSQQTVISQLQTANRRSQTVTSEMLQADHMRQAEIAALWTFDHTRQEQLV
ncbi:hypothetical protein Tco_1534121 [Tanacetum coccineum]